MNSPKEIHFAAMGETTQAVRPILESWLYSQLSPAVRAGIHPAMEVSLRRRRRGPLLRPFLTRRCLEITGKFNWKDYLPVLAGVELLNISTYQSNYCFDEKVGVKTAEARNDQFICTMFTFSAALSQVASTNRLPPSSALGMLKRLTVSNREVYEGQFLDLNILNVSNRTEFTDLETFTEAYLKRCDLIAGSTFRACALGAMCGDISAEVMEALLEYLGALGAAAQIINDLGDFIPHTTKDYAMPYSDFQLGRLTLPTFLMLQEKLPLDMWRDDLRNNPDDKQVEKILISTILELNIEKHVRTFVKVNLFPKIESSLAYLALRLGEENLQPLKFAFPYIFESRMLRYFRKDRSRAW